MKNLDALAGGGGAPVTVSAAPATGGAAPAAAAPAAEEKKVRTLCLIRFKSSIFDQRKCSTFVSCFFFFAFIFTTGGAQGRE